MTNIPDFINDLLIDLVDGYRSIFAENLVGIYLHGSLAMDCFNPKLSDLDFLAVIENSATIDQKKAVISLLAELTPIAPPKGIEMSIIKFDTLRNFTHPTPFELHSSNDWIKNLSKPNADLDCSKHRDADLAAHFTITRERGICLFGKSIREVFPPIPIEHYFNSIFEDAKQIIDQIAEEEPIYAVLNLCRVWAFAKDRLITSKLEGGEWALEKVRIDFRPLVEIAISVYRGEMWSEIDWRRSELEKYARWMIGQIGECELEF